MEYIEGLRIDHYCAANRISTRMVLELFLKVCAAVQYAHQQLIIHRDIKPANILVSEKGEPKLLDFGIARLMESPRAITQTAGGLAMMTLAYASPEQIEGRPLSIATDEYSLGVTLYELLTGTEGGATVCGNLNYNIPLSTTQVVVAEDPIRAPAAGFPTGVVTGSIGGSSPMPGLVAAPATYQLNTVNISGVAGDVTMTFTNKDSTAVNRTYTMCGVLKNSPDGVNQSGVYSFASDRNIATQTLVTLSEGGAMACGTPLSESATATTTPARLFSMPSNFDGFEVGFPLWQIFDVTNNQAAQLKLSGTGTVADIPWNNAALAGAVNLQVVFTLQSGSFGNSSQPNTGAILRMCELVENNGDSVLDKGTFATRLFRGNQVHYTGAIGMSETSPLTCSGTLARWATSESTTITEDKGSAPWPGEVAGYPKLRVYGEENPVLGDPTSVPEVQMSYTTSTLYNNYVTSNFSSPLNLTAGNDQTLVVAHKTGTTAQPARTLTFCVLVQDNGVNGNDGGMFSMDLGLPSNAIEGGAPVCSSSVPLPDANLATVTWPSNFTETVFTPSAWPGFDVYAGSNPFPTSPYVSYATSTGQTGSNAGVIVTKPGFVIINETQQFFAGLSK